MTPPKTPQQLADAIEYLVASHIDEVRRAAQRAIDRSFPSPTAGTRPESRKAAHKTRKRRSAKRRSAEELGELCEKLYELVCSQPGESMTTFSDASGIAVRALHRPMSKLKAEGRIRSVGERNLTRYFPAVGRRSKSADA